MSNVTGQIHAALRERHTGGGNGGGDKWIYADEVSLNTGFSNLWRELRFRERDDFIDYFRTTDYSHAEIFTRERRIDAVEEAAPSSIRGQSVTHRLTA